MKVIDFDKITIDEVLKRREDAIATLRKFHPSFGFLVDLLTINQIKQVKIPEKREEITQEINDILHDIQLILDEKGVIGIDAHWIRDVIILAQFNLHIWVNESNIRKGINDGNFLELTHGLNSIRNAAKNRLNIPFGGKKEYKLDNAKPFPDWIPSGYEEEN